MRREDWAERLHEYIDAARETPFEWAKHDCATFAAGAVEAVTGRRPEFPRYASARAALELQAERSLDQRVTDGLGDPIPVSMAQRGDLLLIGGPSERPALAVCVDTLAAAPGESGLLFFPVQLAYKAWRVGRA